VLEKTTSGGQLTLPDGDDQSVPNLPPMLKSLDSMVSTSTQDSFDLAKVRMSRSRRRIPIGPATPELPVSKGVRSGRSLRSQLMQQGLADSMHSSGTQDSMALNSSRMLRSPILL
jgi:hypothetical protein